MAATPSTKPNGEKTRKRSLSGGLPLLNRSGSMADKTLLGVLNILRMDEEAANTFLVRTILPDGNLRLVSADYNMTIRNLVSGIVQEFHLENYQVRELPAKTIIANLDAKASIVENSEIAIEDVERRMSNFELDNIHAIKDPRLRCVKELLYEEELFFNDLKCLFEVYADPLRKWGMTRADYKTIFEPLETICNLNVRLNNMLNEAVKNWDTSTTLIGGIFTELDILWSTYDDYFQCFRATRLCLKQKRDYEPEFQAFVNMQRGARNTHLEMLLLRPIQHVIDYERILSSLLEKTSADHPDRQDLDHVATNFRRIVRERSEETVAFENEVKINQVQDKFPQDNLCLTEGEVVPRYRLNASRRKSAPSAVLKAALVPRPHLALIRGGQLDGGSLKVKPSSDTTSLSPSRHFVQEGCAQVTVGVSTQERHLFLFSDLLLIAKSKSAASYKLKHRIRVSELWLANCTEDVCESTKSAEKSFLLGWPTTNSVFTFSTVETRNLWFSALTKYIKIQKDFEDPKVVTLKVYNRDMESADSFGVSKSFAVSNVNDASTVVKMSLEQFDIQTDDASEYHLWVLSGKENCAYPLLGHEFPFAIKMNHMREASYSEEDGCNVFDFDQQLPSMDPLSPSTQCQFILTKSRKASKISSIEGQQSSRKWKNPIKKSPIINWAIHKKTTGTKTQNSEVLSPPVGKLFDLPLEVLCTGDEPVPKPIQDILRHLFRYGPGVNGIFRKSASAKRAREIKIDLDSGKEVLFEDVSVVITASILKEFLRRLPDCILDSDDYEEFIGTNNLEDREDRIKQIKWLLQNLNVYSYELLKRFMCVLYHIADNSNINSMNAYNLAVCVAPSMLWPPKGSSIAATEQSNAVPPFVQFLIENCMEIFGEDVVSILGDRSEIVLNRELLEPDNGIEIRTFNSQSSTDDGLESPEPISPRNERSSLHLSDSNLYSADGRAKTLLSAGVPERNSISTPSSPCISPNSSPKLRRPDIEISNQLRHAFYEPNSNSSARARRRSEPSEMNSESTKMRIKGYRKMPRSRRQLSSTTTSAELIEHKQPKTTPSGKRLETAVLRRAHSPLTVKALPVDAHIAKPIPKFAPSTSLITTANRVPPVRHAVITPSSLSNGSDDRGAFLDISSVRCPSPTLTPNQVFQVVDRRRQPAAPSYHQHMLRKIGSKPAFFQGKNDFEILTNDKNAVKNVPMEATERQEEAISTDNSQSRAFVRSSSIPNNIKRRPEPLDLSQSEPCTPNAPLSPTKEEESWPDHRDDMSTSSGGSSSRRLEHSPFGLSLHHKRSSSDNVKKIQNIQSQTKPQIKTLIHNGGNTHFPPSEFFPQEATRVKPQWGAAENSFQIEQVNTPSGTRVISPQTGNATGNATCNATCNATEKPLVTIHTPEIEGNTSAMATLSINSSSTGTSPSLSLRKSSQTSSSSSVSSSDDRSSVGGDVTVFETKTNITQIRDLKELLSVQAQTNGLKISPQTADEIAKVKEIRPPSESRLHTGYTSPSHDDIEKMMFTEESYV